MKNEIVKVYCQHCTSKDDSDRVFEINKDFTYCTCPKCGSTFKVKDGIKAYRNRVDNILKQADIKLNSVNDSYKSYDLYADILTFDNRCDLALCGRILSLFKQSTITHLKIRECSYLIRLDKDFLFKKDNQITTYYFLCSLFSFSFSYFKRIRNNLSYKNYFYDLDCLGLYLKRCGEILSFMGYLFNLFDLITEPKISDNKQFKVIYFHNLNRTVYNVFKQEFIVMDGTKYKFKSFESNSFNVNLTISKDRILVPSHIYKRKRSISNSKKTIKNEVFKNKSSLFFAMNVFCLLSFIFLLFFISFLIVYFLIPGLKGLSLAIFISSIILTIGFFIGFLICYIEIKKV